jgi:8-oxo-dGTP pyrophosphatase MutT (NUDIX family)
MLLPRHHSCAVLFSSSHHLYRSLSSSSSSSSSSSCVYCDAPGTLRDFWPRLVARFAELTRHNGHGRFELLPPMTHHPATSLSQQRIIMDDEKTKKNKTKSKKVAAVLVLLINVDDRPSLVFTERAAHLSQHAAQISFPGGHYDAALDGNGNGDGDGDDGDDDQNKNNNNPLIRTALREAREELYRQNDATIHDDFWSNVQILGQGTALPSIRGVPVYPIYAVLLDENLTSSRIETMWPGHPDEVANVFTVPVCDLLTNETTHDLPATQFNPPVRRAPAFPTGHGTIWGLTAYMLHPTLHQLLQPILCVKQQPPPLLP